MPKEYYVLIKEMEGRVAYVSKNDPNEITLDLMEALSFFSLNHIVVWRKCNPNILNTIATKVHVEGDYVNVTKVE